jgi:DNA mismatch repair ATPase MutS
MCSNFLLPQSVAKASWTYVNTKPNSKDKYMIELPAHVQVPRDFLLKAKRGKGSNQVNKYQTSAVQQLVVELERAFEVQNKRRAKGMQMIFARFDAERHLWAAAAQATALLDALGSLAKTSSNAGYVRANILDCPVNGSASITVSQGRHPIVEKTLHTGEFVPNNLTLGGRAQDGSSPRVLLLSGVNMGGKSTCLRQTCLISILAQIAV